ncbi:hypothetical protein [Phenylobacterium sp.]|uniref:hypothetical protein n=1 Tax=Phenylobacterium sp. TaxID=1871053 RepID=UPI002731FEA8|nr:hypothetical protein [Phenylobacterium sp.]MDP1618661.1 hypothetical protein [Phenylobacterium sp.]MDP1987195.1 hypothetical protein [Phenylobacterium sp.]
MPAFFLVENVTPTSGAPDPMLETPKLSAYWRALQQNEHAAKVLVELHRGLEERRELMRKAAT